jgi:hypothetical protein
LKRKWSQKVDLAIFCTEWKSAWSFLRHATCTHCVPIFNHFSMSAPQLLQGSLPLSLTVLMTSSDSRIWAMTVL